MILFYYWLVNLPSTIKLSLKHWYQRKTVGYDDSELWSLDFSIARFVLPRLKAFRQQKINGVPASFLSKDGGDSPEEVDKAIEAWKAEIDKMILAFEIIAEPDYEVAEEKYGDWKSQDKKTKAGLTSFAKHFLNLWS